MYYAIIKDNSVIATCESEPSTDDMATRGEYSVPTKLAIPIGYSHDGYSHTGTNFSPPISVAPTTESLLASIRIRRDSLLSQSDAMMLSDFPTGTLTREQWVSEVIQYRQALRDFPRICDINNPVYPTL